MHDRLSVHSVTFLGMPLAEQQSIWQRARADEAQPDRLPTRLNPDWRNSSSRTATRWTPSTTCSSPARACPASSRPPPAVGARVVYMLTGGRGELGWEQAAERFCAAIAPCVREAQQAGVALAIENASALYADIHFAHTLRDTITLAEMAGVGVCIDLFHCWAEADLSGLVERALPRTRPDPTERLRARRSGTARPRGPRRRGDPDRAVHPAGTRGWLYPRLRSGVDRPANRGRGQDSTRRVAGARRYRRCWKDLAHRG